MQLWVLCRKRGLFVRVIPCCGRSSDNKGPVLAAIFAAALARNPHRRFGASLSRTGPSHDP
jgi:hypothetical protein